MKQAALVSSAWIRPVHPVNSRVVPSEVPLIILTGCSEPSDLILLYNGAFFVFVIISTGHGNDTLSELIAEM